MPNSDWDWYFKGYDISAILIFIASWIYCIINYGFLLGVGLGWLPSIIVAFVLSFLWPLVLVGIAAFLYLTFGK